MGDNEMRDKIEEGLSWQIRNAPKGYMKGLPILRVLLFGMLLTLMLSYALIYFAGGALDTTGQLTNGTLALQYNAIKGNSLNPTTGIFSGLSTFTSNVSSQANNYTKPTFNTGLIDTLGAAGQLMGSIVPTFSSVLYYAGSVFGYVGIPTGYFELIGSLMFVAALVVAVITIWGVIYS